MTICRGRGRVRGQYPSTTANRDRGYSPSNDRELFCVFSSVCPCRGFAARGRCRGSIQLPRSGVWSNFEVKILLPPPRTYQMAIICAFRNNSYNPRELSENHEKNIYNLLNKI